MKNAGYPAWEYEEHSPLRDLACRVYQEMFQKPLQVVTIHAGLECGLLKDKAPILTVFLSARIFWIYTVPESGFVFHPRNVCGNFSLPCWKI